MKCRIVPFEAHHIESINIRDIFNSERAKEGILAKHGDPLAELVTFLVDEVPAAVLGIYVPRVGFIEAFTVTSELICLAPRQFHRGVKALLGHAEDKYQAFRIQISVRRDFIMGQRWAKALGFELECLAKNYGGRGVDHFIYVRCPNG